MNLYWIAGTAALLAAIFFWLFLRNLKKMRLRGMGLHLLLSSSTAMIAALALAMSLHLYTYARLTYEQPVAMLQIQQLAPQHFKVELQLSDQQTGSYILKGDEWQLDARVLKWRGWAQLLGMNAQYRLDRLSGRYRDINQARQRLPSIYALTETGGPLDLWAIARSKPDWLPWVDAQYGSATYLPLRDKAVYEVKLTQTGLLARPVNADARQAVTNW